MVEYSDLDVRLVVADERVAEAASAGERALDAIGPIELRHAVPGAGEHRLVDLALMKCSAPDLFLERERLAHVRVTSALFQPLVTKEVARGNALAALVFCRARTSSPLALVRWMRHCPERFDFWLKYGDVDLPAPVAATLRRLAYPADLAALARLPAEAEALFHATLAELDAGGAK